MRSLSVLILLVLFPCSVIAASTFTPPPTDKSVELLGYIFGNKIGSVYLGGSPNPALTHMFELFNVVVISIGTIIVSYIGVISTVNTAQEGKTMGRKLNAWVVMRAVLGMLSLVPAPSSGYSIVQTGVMWIILQGIGAADQIWNSVLADLGSGIAINAAIEKPKDEDHPVYTRLENDGIDLSANLLRSAVCMVSLHNIGNRYATGSSEQRDTDVAKYGSSVDKYVITSTNNHITPDQVRLSGTMYVGVRGKENFYDICGRYAINTSVERDEWEEPATVNAAMLHRKALELYNLKKESLEHMLANLMPIAEAIVAQQILKPRDGNGRLRNDPDELMYPTVYNGYMSWATNVYVKILTQAVKPQFIDSVQEIIRKGVLNGWISAGSFYFALNHAPQELRFFDDVQHAPRSEFIPRCDDAAACTRHYPEHAALLNEKLRNFVPAIEHTLIANRLWDANIYSEYDTTSIDESIVDALKRQPGAEENDLQRDVTRLFARLIAERDSDPLLAQGKFGSDMMRESEQAWMNPLHAQEALLARVADENGVISDELRRLINQNANRGSIFLSVYSFIWICGATMAIYIPLIPYMMFTVAILGWFLLVIEAIVAAPILALSFIVPSGEELGKIVQGLMLLLNIVLRPTLMLFGFVLAARLYKAIVHLVNFSMLGNFNNVALHESLFASVAIVCLYVMFILTLSNKCFALIYALPDKILRWMGGAPEHTDATQELQQAKGVMVKGGDAINKISTGLGQRGFDRLQNQVKQADQLNQPNAGNNHNNNRGNNDDPP